MSEFTLIDQLLADQSELQTPVAQASEFYDRAPDMSESFKSLIPLSKPGKGEQYAFQVELDKCTGCKACVAACHSLNGLDDDESWRDVGTYAITGTNTPGISQTVTTACHHCESPECMHGCPVGAYDKDSDTGIVRHLDDQCIGCSYCILKCPFDVPKYNEKRGIVRKCDMCHDRLAEGEAPACVQACPTEAIKIVTVSTAPEHSRFNIQSPKFEVPELFTDLNKFTRPSTQYINAPATGLKNTTPPLKPAHAHAPLIFMLTLTQLGVGLLLLPPFLSDKFLASAAGTALVFAGLGIGALHLGQPLKVWRFFLGLKTSWLSREFAVFGLLTALAPLLVFLTAPFLPDFALKGDLIQITAFATAATALGGVFTSVMLYADTRRQLWAQDRSTFRFYTTVAAATFGGAALLTGNLLLGLPASLILIAKLLVEKSYLAHADAPKWSPDYHSAKLLAGPLAKITLARKATAWLAILTLPTIPIVGLALLALSELIERTLFFTSVYEPRMT